jgi:protein-histidine N-methyltransferase
MAFSFGFSGDDIEEDPNDAQNVGEKAEGGEENGPPPIPARTHALDEMVG